MTGSTELLEVLSPFVPDDVINDALPRHPGVGRRCDWSAAQLYRTLLLLLLTPARSSNLLCQLLPGQRAWRQFAHLPNRRTSPNVRQLHEFRSRLTPTVLRHINQKLLGRLLEGWPGDQPGIALIDATDLPAATNEYKKRARESLPRIRQRSAGGPKRQDRADGSSGIRNTPYGSGWHTTLKRCCWSR